MRPHVMWHTCTAVLWSLVISCCVDGQQTQSPDASVINTVPSSPASGVMPESSARHSASKVLYAVHIAEFQLERRKRTEEMTSQSHHSVISPTRSAGSLLRDHLQTETVTGHQSNMAVTDQTVPLPHQASVTQINGTKVKLSSRPHFLDVPDDSEKETPQSENVNNSSTDFVLSSSEPVSKVVYANSMDQSSRAHQETPSVDFMSTESFVSLDLQRSLQTMSQSSLTTTDGTTVSTDITKSGDVGDESAVATPPMSTTLSDLAIPSFPASVPQGSETSTSNTLSSVLIDDNGYDLDYHEVRYTSVSTVLPASTEQTDNSADVDVAVGLGELSVESTQSSVSYAFVVDTSAPVLHTMPSAVEEDVVMATSTGSKDDLPVTEIWSHSPAYSSEVVMSTGATQKGITQKPTETISVKLTPVSITVDPSSIKSHMMSSYNASGGVVIGGGQPDKKSKGGTSTDVEEGYQLNSPMTQQATKRTTPRKNVEYSDRTKPGNTSPATFVDKKILATTKKPSVVVKSLPTSGPGIAVETIIPKSGTTSSPKYTKMPLYLTVELKMDWPTFCKRQEEFQSLVAKSLNANTKKNIEASQVVLIQTPPCKSKKIYRRKAGIDVDFYIADPKGDYNFELTDKCAEMMVLGLLLKDTALQDKLIGYHIHGKRVQVAESTKQESSKPKNGVLIAIIVGAVAGVAFIILIALQLVVIKRRQMTKKKKRHAYDASRPSLDGHSMDSVQLTAITRMREALAYTNPGLQMEMQNEKNSMTHLVNFAGLDKFANDLDFLAEEFRNIPNFMPPLSEVPLGAEDKNRYANVIPVPQTRVSLAELDGDPVTTYINANYIKGYGGDDRVYIATQAPLDNTMSDFWRMVWEQQVQVIVMLTLLEEKGLSKCAEYWPNTDGGDTVRLYDNLEVVLKERDIRQDFIISTMTVKDMEMEESRELQHYWYTNWPAHRLPEPGLLLKFMLEVHPQMEENHGPTVVHCSPGTGRTGTFLAIDICLRQYNHKRTVDILRTVNRLRVERGGCVQTRDQYIFIYKTMNTYSTMLCNASSSTSSSMSSLNEDNETSGFMNRPAVFLTSREK